MRLLRGLMLVLGILFGSTISGASTQVVTIAIASMKVEATDTAMEFLSHADRLISVDLPLIRIAYLDCDTSVEKERIGFYFSGLKKLGYDLCILALNKELEDKGETAIPNILPTIVLAPNAPLKGLWRTIDVSHLKLGVIGIVKEMSEFPDTYNEFLAQMGGVDWLIVALDNRLDPESGQSLFEFHKEMDLILSPFPLKDKDKKTDLLVEDDSRLLLNITADLPKIMLIRLTKRGEYWHILDVKEFNLE